MRAELAELVRGGSPVDQLRAEVQAEYDAAIAANPRREWTLKPLLNDALRALGSFEKARRTLRARGGDGSHG